ncbi:MAG TPA: NUDIX domain-containing protein [Candidatus Saccharimonadales bacterium]|nr:NUDIX domain-containing protein [Candidatus Saccharimonadales bacterium]
MQKIIPYDSILIPENAAKVFSGQIFDVFQWPQKMFDGSMQTFEMLRRSDTIQTIGVKDDKVVLIKDEQPGRPAQIFPPRGRVDAEDKDWLDAAKREMREETGMTFGQWRLVEVIQPAAKIEWFVATFLATDFVDQEEQQLDGGEKIEVWLESVEKIRELTLNGTYVSYLRPFFTKVNNLDELLSLTEYTGNHIDR